jgi:outer membrane protein OmpA-like peptidoglycan-associated protein/tetratricopeptide (TPR) repeat protein
MGAYRFSLGTLFIALTLVFAAPARVSAQSGGDSKSEFKGSPEKILQLANDLYRAQRFAKAKEAYIEVLKKDPSNYLATVRVAKCSYFIQEYDDAARYFESAIEIDKAANDTVYFEYGITLRVLDRHNDARAAFKEFQKRWKDNDDYLKRVKLEVEGCNYVEEQRKLDPKWRTNCLDVNTAMGDNFPSVMERGEDEKYLVITSSRPASMKPNAKKKKKGKEKGIKEGNLFEAYNEGYSDLWTAKMEDDTTFGVAENMGKKINKKYNDGNSTFSPDGMTMYYSVCNQGKLGYGCSIYETKYDSRSSKWGKPRLVEGLKGTKEVVVDSRGKIKKVATYDVHPNLSADGNTMFFVSDRDGGEGRLDIWYSTFQGDSWSEPQNAGKRINTPFDDISPDLSNDVNTLYFASNGRVGFGGFDLYKSIGGMGSWADAENMGAPINSTYDDLAGTWSKDDSSTYFTSNRPGCTGRDDIYWAKQVGQPPCEFAVHGTVLDKRTMQPVPFAIVILYEFDVAGDLIPLDTFKADQSAAYNFELECNKKYKVVGNAREYLMNEKEFETKTTDPKNDIEINVSIELERIVLERPIVLKNIYYDFDKADLRPSAMSELDSVNLLLSQNPHIAIQIGSHTDSNGSESYNKELSERRAKSAVLYLMQKGIVGERLKWYGFGESQLIKVPEMNDEDEQLNRRTEFRIQSMDFGR